MLLEKNSPKTPKSNVLFPEASDIKEIPAFYTVCKFIAVLRAHQFCMTLAKRTHLLLR
jgi:hypothetical protein